MKKVEVITVPPGAQYGSLLGGLDIYPDDFVKPGYKIVKYNSASGKTDILVSKSDFIHLRSLPASEETVRALGYLIETDEYVN